MTMGQFVDFTNRFRNGLKVLFRPVLRSTTLGIGASHGLASAATPKTPTRAGA
jgi:hypothetical protein